MPLTGELPYDLKVAHHPGRMVLENVTVIHPLAWAIVGHPRDAHPTLRRHVHGVFPRTERRRLAVDVEDLEEEAVQMEGMVHHRVVDDVPYLQIAHLPRLVSVMRLLVHKEVHAAR